MTLQIDREKKAHCIKIIILIPSGMYDPVQVKFLEISNESMKTHNNWFWEV